MTLYVFVVWKYVFSRKKRTFNKKREVVLFFVTFMLSIQYFYKLYDWRETKRKKTHIVNNKQYNEIQHVKRKNKWEAKKLMQKNYTTLPRVNVQIIRLVLRYRILIYHIIRSVQRRVEYA